MEYPFVDRFPKNSLYKIMTTRLEETEAGLNQRRKQCYEQAYVLTFSGNQQ